MVNGIKENSEIYKLILTSKGFNTHMGKEIIRKVYEKEKMKPGSIFFMTVPEYEVDDIVVKSCKELGFTDMYLAKDFEDEESCAFPDVDAIFVTEGNTFEVADYLRKNHFDEYIKNMVKKGATYIGASAGAILAAGTFKEAENFDMNFIGMRDFSGLGLLPRNGELSDTVIPHYTYNQLQNYIKSMTEDETSSYKTIYNICNEEALVMECKRIGENVELVRKRRIRIE